MTSISQSVIPPQASNNASQTASNSGRAPPQAAGTASAAGKTSYASATKKTFSPPPASGDTASSIAAGTSQHGKPDNSSPVNGKAAIPPATPAVGALVNGNTPTSSTSGVGDHSRKPSVTISAAGVAGPSGYINGGLVAGKSKGGRGLQFGAMPEVSPTTTNAVPVPNNSSNSLAVNVPANPRVISPQTSPSPIPQPPASGGGRPPVSLHGSSTSVSFGNFTDGNQMRAPGVSSGPLTPGPQPNHLRRESSQSQHSDMSSHGMGPAAGRGGFPPQGGRGRGSFQGAYPPQMGGNYFNSNNRPPPNQPRGSQNMPPFQGQTRNLAPYPNSPHQSSRSPSLTSAQPALNAHPQPGQVPMTNPQMAQPPYGFPHYTAYPQAMGPQQVNPQSSSSLKHKFPGNAAKGSRTPFASTYRAQPLPDLSPTTGHFEQYLTSRHQAPYVFQDPNYSAANYYNSFYGNMAPPMQPSSPRPPQQMTPVPQQPPYLPSQYGTPQQPPSMSRTSSAISHNERPNSSIDRSQAGSTTPAMATAAISGRQVNSPAPKSNDFKIPQKKKNAGLVIKNPTTGEVVAFDKPSASPAPPSKSQTPAVASTPTPPPRAPSHTDSQHSRTESKSVKTDEEKRNEMRDAIARKMEADKAEEQRKKLDEESKASQESKEAEEKLLKEKEESENKEREAAQKEKMAEEALKKDKADAEEAEKAAATKAKEEADEAAEKARKAKEEEDEILAMEAEYAEMERQEAEREERYQQKKKAEQEEAARKEAEALKMADEDMKRAEREAEEAEEARLKELEKSEGDESQKERVNMFAALKKDGTLTPSSDTQATEESQVNSGVATPASDIPAAPSKPSVRVGKQKPADLKLDTMKTVEAGLPTPQLASLRSARPITQLNKIQYPPNIASPNPALNQTAPMGKFRYDKDFLLEFSKVFTEKPSEDWELRLKETIGDTTESTSARTPARGTASGGPMMGGRQPSNRGPPPQAVMGSFAQGGRTLPPGTSSQQRYEAATAGRSAAPSRQTMNNPLASLVSRPGGFPQPGNMSIKMDRTPSSTSINHPNSPRNASQRGGSQRGSRPAGRREDPKDNKAMPLTAGAALKPIEVTSSGWKPRSVGQNATGMAGPAPGGDGHMAPDVVQRKVKSNLNKMTPNNFDKITSQILEISAQSKDESDGRTLRQVIQLTFEKATDEAHWAEMYAQFCKRMLESMSPEIKDENILDKKGEVVHGGALFRKYLLNRCQEEFERGWKLNLGDKPEGETEEATMLSDQYYVEAAAKRRGLGLVRFIGELYKLGMLTERIMHECVKKLVDYEGVPDEAEVESLTNLLKTIGQPLDSTERGPKMMDAYFVKINEMIAIEGLPSRLRFMLMDIVDLRKKHWQGKGGVLKGPTTLEEVRAQAAQAEREKELQRQAESSRRGGGGGGRPPVGRGDARNFSGGGQYGGNMMPPPDHQRNIVGMDDLRRLGSKGASRQVSSQGQPTLGPTSMFGAPRGSNTRRPGLAAAQKDDSGASSRTGTPPAQKNKEEKEAAKSANTFSALAGLDSSETAENASPSTSPPVAKSQPVERQQSRSPKKDPTEDGGSKGAETS